MNMVVRAEKKMNSGRRRKEENRTKIVPPRGVPTNLIIDSQPTMLDYWKQLPAATRLYFVIMLILLALLFLLILVRSASLPMNLAFLRNLRGDANGISQETGAAHTAESQNVSSDKPVAVALVDVEMYSGPAFSYPVVGLLETGQTAEIEGVSSDGNWWAVKVLYIQGERAWLPSAQVQTYNTEGVEVVALPAELLAATRIAANPPVATALINVNIRSGPGLDFPKIGLLSEGLEAQILGVDSEAFWYMIKIPGEENLQGWVSKDYVKVRNAENLPVIGEQAGTPILIPLTTVNVRAGPGKEYAILGSLEKGKGVEIIGISPDGQWWAINFGIAENGKGWVSSNFVTVENAESVPVLQQ